MTTTELSDHSVLRNNHHTTKVAWPKTQSIYTNIWIIVCPKQVYRYLFILIILLVGQSLLFFEIQNVSGAGTYIRKTINRGTIFN